MKRYRITVNGQNYDVAVEEVAGGTASHVPSPVTAVPAPAAPVSAPAPQAAPAAPVVSAGVAGANSVRAPMPGTVLAFKVAAGQEVRRGDVLLLLEAMKMENEIVAPADGTVAALRVAAGAAVNTGDPLVDIV